MPNKESATPRRVGAREWIIRLGLMLASLVVAVILAEFISRLVFPISDRRENLTLDGKPIDGFMIPGSVYRQVTNEYDVLTTITDKGHRVPEVNGNPEVVFIGDSITFGFGLTDEETFVSVYCKAQRLKCANLGLPGAGTKKEIERLEQFMTEWNWRPRRVVLVFAGMSESFSAGSDFVDNFDREREERRQRAGAPDDDGRPGSGMAERIIGQQVFLLRHSNLIRMAKFYAGPMLKSLIVAEPGEERMKIALEATAASLRRLDELSRQFGFDYQIILVVPVQDILRGTSDKTLQTLNSVSPKAAVSTAPALADAPADYYYAFDGHLNPRGAKRVAELLIELDQGTP
jgi:hypothetical protein